MRVRTGRFRSGGQDCSPPHDALRRPRPRHPMLPIGSALIGHLARSGVIGSDILSAVGCQPTSSALHARQDFRFLRLHGRDCAPGLLNTTMASADFSRHFLREISPGKVAVLPRTAAAFTSTTEPVGFAVLCQLVPSYRPSMWFLFISLQVSSSLPPPGRLPSRSWLQLVIYFMFSCFGSFTGDSHPIYNAPMLGAHKTLHPTAGNAPV